MLEQLWFWVVQVYSAAYAAAFDSSHAFTLRFLASSALVALIMAPCAIVAFAARALGASVRQKVRQAEQAHPLVLVGFGGKVAQSLEQAAQRRDELAPNNMSLPRLSDALEAAETLLLHARTIRDLDKARRKPSLLLRLVDMTTNTPQEEALNHATDRFDKLHDHARLRSRAEVQQRTVALATANPEVAAQHRQLLAEIAECTEQAQRAEEWAQLAWSARSAMLAAKQQCSSASTTELFDLVSKNKAVAAWSTFDSHAASAAVSKANRAVAALRAALPDHESLRLARVPIPSDFFDLILDLTVAPGLDILSFFNMSALSDAAARCGRAAGQLAEFSQRATDLAARARAALQRATNAKETLEAPFVRTACNELPSRLRALV